MAMNDDPDNAILDPGVAELDEMGAPGGTGLTEIAPSEVIDRENMEERERLYNPSDLQDVGDPEGTDVGVPFGLAAGGVMSEGARGYDGNKNDPWGVELNDTFDPADTIGMAE